MLVSHDWLRAFVPHDCTPEQIHDLLSAHVATVDSMQRLRTDLAEIIVARVVEAAPHPNSDHLWVTRVDDGSGALLDVVCGAPNVAAGTLYPFARSGTVMPNGLKIEKRKIRGETSNGMLCSARELGLGEEHQGILALDLDVAPGTPFLDAMPVGDVRLDVDVLPNRPDLLSHLGLARELSALTGIHLGEPAELGAAPDVPNVVHGEREATSGGATVRLEDREGCPRYMGIVIRGVTVGPSPDWLVRRLGSIGVRSISNVVDVTNYLLHGYGQPMHAFDMAKLSGGTVVIRRALAGETLVTLDGVERKLDPRMTVIADAERAIAVAGVMGGRESEVTDATTDVFLEVAYFAPRAVRLTRRALGLSTDASHRYERGIDPALAPRALAVAATLITRAAGGRVDGAPIDTGAPPEPSAPVTLRPARVVRLLGDAVPAGEIAHLLSSIGFRIAPAANEAMLVIPPSWRADVSREADLVEEVARLRGFDILPDELKPFRPGNVPDHPLYLAGRKVRDVLVGLGLLETRPLPFVKGDDSSHVRVRNPLADDEPHLRTTLLDTLARRAEYNLSRMVGDIRLFEIGSAFEPRADALPHEELRVAALIMGQRRPPHFTEPRPPAFDAWDAKALGERIAAAAYPLARVALVPAEGDAFWTVNADGSDVGMVRPVTLDKPVWAADAWGVEITLGVLANAPLAAPGSHAHDSMIERTAPALAHVSPFRPLPTTPAAEFDLALLVPDSMAAADVERVLRSHSGELLERVVLFDEFRSDSLPAGHRSLAWRLTFRDSVRTLRDKEVEGRRQKIVSALERELGVRQRES